ncbi:hypothetical protein ADUPG1_011996 [Aduncisulcus paluster]|uniref:Uncharacterized protein n=1 Tax=Aduncisulcus paluster TaxID=2918883 RepID=A0ABQ5JZR8_9EUKA|nr:hypothetical protein ADUPG1_011996 [Aduncisulcus paluster]
MIQPTSKSSESSMNKKLFVTFTAPVSLKCVWMKPIFFQRSGMPAVPDLDTPNHVKKSIIISTKSVSKKIKHRFFFDSSCIGDSSWCSFPLHAHKVEQLHFSCSEWKEDDLDSELAISRKQSQFCCGKLMIERLFSHSSKESLKIEKSLEQHQKNGKTTRKILEECCEKLKRYILENADHLQDKDHTDP